MARRGGTRFTSNRAAVQLAVRAEATKRVATSANIVRNQILETLSGQRSGRRYRVPGTDTFYTASAPGEPPAVRLGDLRRSIEIRFRDAGRRAFIGSVLQEDYPIVLEKGSFNMAPRPYMRPSFEKVLPRIKAEFRKIDPGGVV